MIPAGSSVPTTPATHPKATLKSKLLTKKKQLTTLLVKLGNGSVSNSNLDEEDYSTITNPYMMDMDFSIRAGRERFKAGSKGDIMKYNLRQKDFPRFWTQAERAAT